MAYMSART